MRSRSIIFFFPRGGKVSRLLQAAHAALQNVHINLFDLLDDSMVVHPTMLSLAEYTAEKDLFFPVNKAENEGLRALSRKLRLALWLKRKGLEMRA